MFTIKIASIKTFFGKFFSPDDGEKMTEAVRAAGAARVVFGDTGVTPILRDTIKAIKDCPANVIMS